MMTLTANVENVQKNERCIVSVYRLFFAQMVTTKVSVQ